MFFIEEVSMNTFKSLNNRLMYILILRGLMSSLPLYAGPNDHGINGASTPKSPVVSTTGILGAAATFGAFGGASGLTNQGIYTVINGDIGTTAVTTMITGFHDRGAVYTETPLNIGAVNGTVFTASHNVSALSYYLNEDFLN